MQEDYHFEAIDLFKHLAQGKTLSMSVFARVEKVADVVLGVRGSTLAETVNGQLIRAGLALVEKKREKRYHPLITSLLEVQSEAKSKRVS